MATKRRKRRGLGTMDYQEFIRGCDEDIGKQDCNGFRICVKNLRALANNQDLPKGHRAAARRVLEENQDFAFVSGCAKPGDRPSTMFSGVRTRSTKRRKRAR